MRHPISKLGAHTAHPVRLVAGGRIRVNNEIGICNALYDMFVCNQDWNVAVIARCHWELIKNPVPVLNAAPLALTPTMRVVQYIICLVAVVGLDHLRHYYWLRCRNTSIFFVGLNVPREDRRRRR